MTYFWQRDDTAPALSWLICDDSLGSSTILRTEDTNFAGGKRVSIRDATKVIISTVSAAS